MRKESLKEKKRERGETKLKFDLDTQKELAKIGMTASLVTLVATSFNLKPKLSKQLHVISGATLVGFSLWHHMLYQSKKEPDKTAKTEEVVEAEEVAKIKRRTKREKRSF